LQQAGEDEHPARGSEAGEDRCGGEPGRSRDERRPSPVAVTDGATHEVERCKGEGVGEDDPLLPGETEVEILRDRGQGDENHRRVDEGERRPEDGRGQGQRATLIQGEGLHEGEDMLARR
jgi:hypothetical protein